MLTSKISIVVLEIELSSFIVLINFLLTLNNYNPDKYSFDVFEI